MIIIAGYLDVVPERRDEAIQAARTMEDATRQEAGCISYTFSSTLEDPNRFTVFEEWEDEASLLAHFKAPHMATFRRSLRGIAKGKTTVTRYEVSASTPL